MIRRILNKVNIPLNSARLTRIIFGKHYPAFVENATAVANEEFSGIIFDTPSSLTQWRGRTLLTKEPEKIAWIVGFVEGDVLYDIGANIGIYSLYAVSKKKARVFAFEPSPFNFSTLSRNIALNKFSKNISAFCVALSDKTVLDYLHMSSVQTGAAHNGFQQAINEFGLPMNTVHSQAMLGFRMDDFISMFNLSMPNHIKIDVDGAEALVIAGANNTLRYEGLKSILVELPARNGEKFPEVIESLISLGFKVIAEDHPAGDVRLSNYILQPKRAT